MRKLGLGALALVVVGGIYYFTTGSTQIAQEMQKQVNHELTLASSNGFTISDKVNKEKSNHFVLSFDDSNKITHFLNTQGMKVSQADIKALKGLTLGVDINYLADSYSAVSMDVYPLTLPNTVRQQTTDKELIVQLEKIVEKKSILVHIDMNKLGSGFKGYLKDISETVVTNGTTGHITLQGVTFKGALENKKLKSLSENLKNMTLGIKDDVNLSLQNMQGEYLITGKTPYDYSAKYKIDKIGLNGNKNQKALSFTFNNNNITTTSHVNNGLASGSMQFHTQKIKLQEQADITTLDDFILETNVSNLDIQAFEKLQNTQAPTQKETTAMMQQLISKGVAVHIKELSAKNIIHKNQKLEGFKLLADIAIDKSLNITATKSNPLAALDTIDAKLRVELSKPLFGLIASQPQAMMALMLFQPTEENNQKVYSLELKDGKASVNGMSIN